MIFPELQPFHIEQTQYHILIFLTDSSPLMCTPGVVCVPAVVSGKKTLIIETILQSTSSPLLLMLFYITFLINFLIGNSKSLLTLRLVEDLKHLANSQLLGISQYRWFKHTSLRNTWSISLCGAMDAYFLYIYMLLPMLVHVKHFEFGCRERHRK